MTDGFTAKGSIEIDLSSLSRSVATAKGQMGQFEQAAEKAAAKATALNARADQLTISVGLQARQLVILQGELAKTTTKYGEGSSQVERKKLQIDRLTASMQQNTQQIGALRSQAGGLTGGFGQAESGASKLRSGLGGLQSALGAVGIAFGAAEAIQFTKAAIDSANELETTQAVMLQLSGSQNKYNEIVALATENQRLFGGSLNANLQPMNALLQMSNRTGASIADLNKITSLLQASAPGKSAGDAAFSVSEFLSNNGAEAALSLADQFNLPKNALTELAQAENDAESRITGLTRLLAEQGVTAETLAASTNTTAQTYRDLGQEVEELTGKYGALASKGLEPATIGATNLLKALQGDSSAAYASLDARSSQAFALLDSLGKSAEEYLGLREKIAATDGTPPTQVTFTTTSMYTEQYEDDLRRRTAAELVAAGKTKEALALMREAGGLTKDELEKLDKEIVKAEEAGAKAFLAIAEAEAEYQADRTEAAAENTEKIADIEDDLAKKRAAFTREQAAAEAQAAQKLKDIRADLGRKLEDIDQGTAKRLADIANKAREVQAQAYRQLQNDIASSSVDMLASQEANDLDLPGAKGKSKVDLGRREAAEDRLRERTEAAQAEARDRAANGDAESAREVLGIRQDAIGKQLALEETYERRKAELRKNPAALAALETEYQEAAAAARDAENTRVQLAEQSAAQRNAEREAERQAVLAAAAEQRAAAREVAAIQIAAAQESIRLQREEIAQKRQAEQDAAAEAKALQAAAFAEEERQAAAAHAKEQAELREHLGRTLIERVRFEGEAAGLSGEQIDKITQYYAEQYGVQLSDAEKFYGEYADLAKELVATGGKDLEAYADKFAAIEKKANDVTAAVNGIPTEVKTTVTFTTIQEGSALQEQRAGERNPEGRALGGPVNPNTLYEVAEGGIPEILDVGGKTYLMMGRSAGVVVPAAASAAAASIAGRTATSTGAAAAAGGAAPSLTIQINNPVVSEAAQIQQLADRIADVAVERMFGGLEPALRAGTR